MRHGRTWLALCAAAAVGAGVAITAGTARAGDDGKDGGGMPPMPTPQKVIKQAYVDCLLGTWSTESSGPMGASKGTATYHLGVGDTALLEDYETAATMPGGPQFKFAGHGIFKVSDDGKTVTAWWIDTHSPEPMKMSGPLTDKGLDMSADTPGGKIRITMDKTPDGQIFKMYMADKLQMTDVYKPNPK